MIESSLMLCLSNGSKKRAISSCDTISIFLEDGKAKKGKRMRGNGSTGVYSASLGGQLSPPPLYLLT